VPCIKQPRIRGAAEAPKLIVALQGSLWPIGTGTSPFDELAEVYSLVRLSLSDSSNPPGEVAIYEVDRHIEGASIAPPVSLP